MTQVSSGDDRGVIRTLSTDRDPPPAAYPQGITPSVEYPLHVQRRMKRDPRSVVLLTVLAVVMAGGTAVDAQQPLTRMGGVILSAFAGGAAFTDLQRSEARAERLQPPTNPIEFTRRLSPETSPALALAAGYWFNESLGLRLHAGVALTRFEIGVSERDEAMIPADTALMPRAPFERLSIWSYDATVLIRAPITPRGRIAPYGLIGGGVLRYSPSGSASLPPEAATAFAGGSTLTRGAVVLGLGAIVPLQRNNLGLTFELTDHLSRTPVERTAPGLLAEGESIRIVSSETNPGGKGRVATTNSVRLLIGVSLLLR